MNCNRKRARTAYPLIVLVLATFACTAFAEEPAPAGQEVFERHCRTCHGGSRPADLPIGPCLDGVYGAKAGTRSGGTHTRATLESGIVWDRETLRGFLSVPRREIAAASMPDGLADPEELESLLDYLESLH